MTAIVVSIITYLLELLIDLLLPLINSVLNNYFYTATAFEAIYGSAIGINLTNTYNIIYKYAIAILVVFFIKKLIETYFSWSAGDPDTSPFAILVNFLKAMIVMIFFGYLYRLFIRVMYELFNTILSFGIGDTTIYISNITDKITLSLFGWILFLIVCIYLLLLYFQNLNRGLQTLILRIGIPFAAIGLLNSDGGAFKGYSKKLLQNTFTVMIQLILIKVGANSICNCNIFLGLAIVMAAIKIPNMLSEFLISSGSSSERGLGGAINGTMATLSHGQRLWKEAMKR